jgi:hypothetical protein
MALLPESSCGILVCVCKGVVCTRARASVGPMRNTRRVPSRRTALDGGATRAELRPPAQCSEWSVNVFFYGARRMPRVTLWVHF